MMSNLPGHSVVKCKYVCLLNQLVDEQLVDEQHVSNTWTYSGCDDDKSVSRVTDGIYGQGLWYSMFVSNECLSKSTSTCQDDCLYFKVDYNATKNNSYENNIAIAS